MVSEGVELSRSEEYIKKFRRSRRSKDPQQTTGKTGGEELEAEKDREGRGGKAAGHGRFI
jgi:hypothetical protein